MLTKENCNRPHRATRGFTLVELLVVIAIIGVLVALLLPAVQSAREAARRAQCQSGLKQIGLAILNYTSTHAGALPPGGITNGPCCSTKSKENWAISILPYLEKQNLYDQYDFDAFNEDEVNWPVLQALVETYLCPSDEDTDTLEMPATGPGSAIPMARGSYKAVVGRCGNDPVINFTGVDKLVNFKDKFDLWKGPFYAIAPERRRYSHLAKGPKLKQITDGLSNTIYIGESTSGITRAASATAQQSTAQRRTFWAYTYSTYNKSCAIPETRTLQADFSLCLEVGGPSLKWGCKNGWGSLHPGGLHFSFGDGSVHFLNTSIDTGVYVSLATIAGDEITDSSNF